RNRILSLSCRTLRPTDVPQSTARLGVRRIAMNRLVIRLRGAGGVGLHQQNVALEDIHPRPIGKERLVEREHGECFIELVRASKAEGGDVQLTLAKVVRRAAVVSLA